MTTFSYDTARAAALQWTNPMSEFPTVYEQVVTSIQMLLHNYIPAEDDYAAEKLAKSFAEAIYYLNSIYHQQATNDIGMDYRGAIITEQGRIAWVQALKEIEAKLLRDVARQYRHFTTFLTAARANRPRRPA